jgi:hypothetical protein
MTEPPKGTRPLPEPYSVQNILLFILQHGCKKLLFFDIRKRILVYFGVVFFLSLVVDFIPTPKTYFARKDNFINQYFVKIAWGWTLITSIPFVALTSFTYCCGRNDRVVKHCSRLLIATCFWYFWTNLYVFFENSYGKCSLKGYGTKSSCLGKGAYWQSIDISGHCFILIYSSLILIEEARVIVSWESITDLIRDEEHARSISDKSARTNPLRSLQESDFLALKDYYTKFTPYIRILFFGITALTVVWDLMLLTTILYFHNMLEKLVACTAAVFTWYFTYKFWYPTPKILPEMPGQGLFKYKDIRVPKENKVRNRTSNAKVPGPTFMGMPLRIPEEPPVIEEDKLNNS